MAEQNLPVTGMSCAACAVSIESLLKKTAGIEEAHVNFASAILQVKYQDALVSPLKIQEVVRSIGYDVLIAGGDEADIYKKAEEASGAHLQRLKKRLLWTGIFTIPVFVIAMFFMEIPYANFIQWILCTPVITYFGSGFFIRAWKNLRHRNTNMDTLVAMSTGTAYIFSIFNTVYPQYWHRIGIHPHVYFEATSVVIFFILTGKYLEEKAKKGTGDAIKKLAGLQVKTASVKINGDWVETKIEALTPGMTLRVKPGEKIPVDGTVLEGHSFIDESAMTGEPIPAEKKTGSAVLAGTLNLDGSFEMTAEKSGNDSMLAGIIKAVRNAQSGKTPTEKLADRISGIFVPVVLIISVLTLCCWIIWGGKDGFSQGIVSMVTVLVIACPCALGLATPAAITTGIGRGALSGILVRDSASLEAAATLTDVVLDKTGTVTEGKPSVAEIRWKEKNEQSQHSSILLTMAEKSDHPLSVAIRRYLKEFVASGHIFDFRSVAGKGTVCFANRTRYFLGNKTLLESEGVRLGEPAPVPADASVVYFANQNDVLATILIRDPLKPKVAQALAKLRAMGIQIHLVSGDRPETTAFIAQTTGIEQYQGNTLPAGKSEYVKNLQKAGCKVGMAGDGINDSEAMAAAEVGFAMAHGSDIAMEVAGLTLTASHPAQVARAIELSRGTMRVMKQNLFWAFIYNLIGIPVAAGLLYPLTGYLLNPMLAGAMMALSSVSVVTNSLRLRNLKLD